MAISLNGDFDLSYGFYLYMRKGELGKRIILVGIDISYSLSSCSRLLYLGNKS